jgi:hypothetical protein
MQCVIASREEETYLAFVLSRLFILLIDRYIAGKNNGCRKVKQRPGTSDEYMAAIFFAAFSRLCFILTVTA